MFYWLEQAFERRHPYIQWVNNNYFDDHKDDPRFINLLERLDVR